MHDLKLDMLTTETDVIVVTTNGFTKRNGEAVMGRGIAKEVSGVLPEVPRLLGQKLVNYGNKVHLIGKYNPAIVTFPVKSVSEVFDGSNCVEHAKRNYRIGDTVPGFHCKARLDIIEQSCKELVELANQHPEWNTILVPRAGCGAGELSWDIVQPLMAKYLDNRFIVCHK